MELSATQLAGVAISSGVFAAAFFDLSLWLVRRQDRHHLFAFLASISAATFGIADTLQIAFGPGRSNAIAERIQYLALLGIAPSGVAFAAQLNQRRLGTKGLVLAATSAVLALLTIFTNLFVSSSFEDRQLLTGQARCEPLPGPLAPVFFAYVLICGFTTIASFIAYVRRARRLEWCVVPGTLIFVAASVNDVLVEFGVLKTGYFFIFGVGGLGLAIAAVAIASHAGALESAEQATSNLAAAVEERTRELRDAQARLLQEHQLAALGRLSASIAHEINNPLAAIQANLSFLGESIPLSARNDGVDAALSESLEACQRASEIVKDLSTFARKRHSKAVRVRLASPITAALRFLSRAYPHASSVVTNLDEHVEVMADESRLGQVAANLLENALQAVDKPAPDRGRVRVDVYRRGNAALLVVEDNGPGVPNELKSLIFNPFFTTKEVGRGTGLGLSICARIIGDHGGSIRVEDAEDGGARFVVELPHS